MTLICSSRSAVQNQGQPCARAWGHVTTRRQVQLYVMNRPLQKWLLKGVPGLAGSRRLAADCRLGGEQVSKHARSACPSPSPVSYQVGGALASVPSGPAWADGGLVRMAGLEKQ